MLCSDFTIYALLPEAVFDCCALRHFQAGSSQLAILPPSYLWLNGIRPRPLGSGSSGKVSWCFEPSQPQRITSGLNTNFIYLKVIHYTSHYTTSLFFPEPQPEFYPQFRNAKPEKQTHVLEPIYIPRALNRVTCFILRACTGTGVSHS